MQCVRGPQRKISLLYYVKDRVPDSILQTKPRTEDLAHKMAQHEWIILIIIVPEPWVPTVKSPMKNLIKLWALYQSTPWEISSIILRVRNFPLANEMGAIHTQPIVALSPLTGPAPLTLNWSVLYSVYSSELLKPYQMPFETKCITDCFLIYSRGPWEDKQYL